MTAELSQETEGRLHQGAAALNRDKLAKHKVFCVAVFGGPCSGKTSLLEATLKHLDDPLRIAVVVGNFQAGRDAERLSKYCRHVVPIETIDLSPELLREALLHLDLSATDLLLVERAAEASPHVWDLGQSAIAGVFSAAGGDDKVSRHPERIEHAAMVLLNKIDLLPYVPFDRRRFEHSVRAINPVVPIVGVSTVTGQGVDAWCDWLRGQVEQRHADNPNSHLGETEYFVG